MKILWTVNLIPGELAEALQMQTVVLGGWVEAMAGQLRKEKDLSLAICCKTGKGVSFDETVNGVRYFSLGYDEKTSCEALTARCREILDRFVPDLVQLEGTEFLHAKAMLLAAKEKGIPVIASMQGILNGQYQYQCGELELDDLMWSGSPTNIVSGWMLHLRKTRWYKPRMKPEREIIGMADYILGRTTWDRAHSYALNPKAEYFAVNRNLRAPFYEKSWLPEKMERHSIYVGNGYRALKGLHFVVEALPLLIREYPDVKVYVAGDKPFQENDKRSIFKKGYGAYLKKRIKDLGVGDHIEFTGPLQAPEVAEKLSRVNCYLLCSTIENSPNTLGEAMLVGTPCVAAYVGGVSDMATDGEEALFYRSNDPVLLAWAVKRIFDDESLALRLSENGKKKAAQTHDTAINAGRLVDAYRTILAKKAGA